jgi:hypothetical protein
MACPDMSDTEIHIPVSPLDTARLERTLVMYLSLETVSYRQTRPARAVSLERIEVLKEVARAALKARPHDRTTTLDATSIRSDGRIPSPQESRT